MKTPTDMNGATTPENERKLQAALAFVRRTGAQAFQLRYSDDEQPVIWMAVARYPNGNHEVAASFEPVRAVIRLCERLADGGTCTHCGRMTGLEPDELGDLPLSDVVCWYVYDPELATFRRGCEGDAP